MPTLIKTVLQCDKTVVEVGGGTFSTPLLHWLCYMRGIKLITYENDPDFYRLERDFRSANHRIIFVKDWDEMDTSGEFGAVLIDNHPSESRGDQAIKFKDNADFVILHDSEAEKQHNYDKVWQYFKYRYDWKDTLPYTTVLSNKNDLTCLKNI